MRHLLKFLHTIGAIGLMGAMACLVVLGSFSPPPTSLSEYAAVRAAMAEISQWVYLPALTLTLIAGLLAIAVNRAFHNAGWAWAKAATGILIFEFGLTSIQGPIQQEAERSASALSSHADPATLTGPGSGELGGLWVMLAIAAANVALGVWRPRFKRTP